MTVVPPSGIDLPGGIPGTFGVVGVVPNENMTLFTLVSAVTPFTVKVNVADPLRNGLWAELSAIDPFAVE
jgi:hypothetical protein